MTLLITHDTKKMKSPGQKVPNMLLEKSGENSRRNEETEPKQNQHPDVHVASDGSKL